MGIFREGDTLTLVPTGYPDWSRRAARSDELLIDRDIGPGALPADSDILSVGGSAGIGMRHEPIIGGVRVTVRWTLDELGTIFLAQQTLSLRNGMFFSDSLPTLGPFVQFRTVGSSGAAFTALRVWTVWTATPHAFDMNDIRLINVNLTSVAAGVTSSSTSFRAAPGLAILNVLSEAATFTVFVESVDHLSASTVLYRFDEAGTRSQTHLIAIPATQIRVSVVNNTAAAADFSYFLHAGTFAPIT